MPRRKRLSLPQPCGTKAQARPKKRGKRISHLAAEQPHGAEEGNNLTALGRGKLVAVEVIGRDATGEAVARPLTWRGKGRPPLIHLRSAEGSDTAPAVGERGLVRLRLIARGRYCGEEFRTFASAPVAAILGIYEEGRILPTDRRNRQMWIVPPEEREGIPSGRIVLAEPLSLPRGSGPRRARIREVLGEIAEPRAISLICIHAHGIPEHFPAEALREAERARGVSRRGRVDLRHLPLVTIDGPDARDFDDAVFAEAIEGGWRVVVAIADVAHYVAPGSALDREAWARGNSVYFPDRVVPMLPEALSAGWCSLRPGEERGCLFVEMQFDQAGRKLQHRFGRGIMRSAARLTYEAVQEAAEAGRDPPNLPEGSIAQLYGAFRALLRARQRRGTLDLELPERQVLLDATGKVRAVVERPRCDAHRLIEEFMIAANVAAAEELERLGEPCLYRVHEPPSATKCEGLRRLLASLGLSFPATRQLRAGDFTRLLERVKGRPEQRLIQEAVLRTQAQAAYATENAGHFGLALPRYVHFTSPIRRYADLLIQRALIRGLGLGKGGLADHEAARLPETADHVTETERRAVAAERDALERYLAAYLAERIGCTFMAWISGVTRFGLFVTLEENGATGLLPLTALPFDRWHFDQASLRLTGRQTGLVFTLGQAMHVRLVEANRYTGAMVFHLGESPPLPAKRGAAGRR